MGNRIFGKKIGMTRYFIDEGQSGPVTLVKAGLCVVIQKKTAVKDGLVRFQGAAFERGKGVIL